ncbi:hypothetical protein [Deinococcus arenicola]|uniref:Uncharacterized protein n=1 Tax=Deinococcus arenicola TaxID=2994950 RepID=A0ABU4DVL3_9DEIO|nr:hypothetical protein [Deinococcus sp. ZS9-10]MDV6376482.1 hypothetical protein [Deinococcus sp. ZS9-10]
MTPKDYLKHCMAISLRRRASWLAAGGLGGLALAVVLNLSPPWLIGLALLGAGLVAVGVAAHSCRRHSDDPAAQPRNAQPIPAAAHPTDASH